MSSLRTWAAWSILAVILLAGPALARLAVIAAEALIDLTVEVGVPAILALISAGAVGWVLARRFWASSDTAQQSGPGLVSDETAIAAPPG
jgi:hypothetical protein